ncbi:MAG: ABC transporter substrate-binding protein, partial [Rubrobacteraceae bacterium]
MFARRVGKIVVTMALTLAVVFAVAACGGGDGGSQGGGGEQNVNIGFSGPLSGGAAFYGENVMDGIQMAVDEINQAGGIEVDGTTTKFSIESLDDKYLPNETATNVRRLVQQSQTPVIFVPHSGGIFAAQELNTNPPTEFVLGAYSSVPEILERDNPNTVMIPPRFDNYMQPFVETEMGMFGNKLGLIPTTSEYGLQWTEQVTAEWEKQGGEVLSDNGVDYTTTTDYAGPVSRALSENPDVLFVGGPSQPTAIVIEEARKQGFEGGFIVMDQAKFEEMETFTEKENLNGSVGIFPTVDYPGPGTDQFVEYYREKIGGERPPTSEVALNYQGMHIIAKAMELAGSTDDIDAIMAEVDQAA